MIKTVFPFDLRMPADSLRHDMVDRLTDLRFLFLIEPQPIDEQVVLSTER